MFLGPLSLRHQRPAQRSRQAGTAGAHREANAQIVQTRQRLFQQVAGQQRHRFGGQGTHRYSLSVSTVTRATPSRRSNARASHGRDMLSASAVPNDVLHRCPPISGTTSLGTAREPAEPETPWCGAGRTVTGSARLVASPWGLPAVHPVRATPAEQNPRRTDDLTN